jgi:hypothetical protein
MLPTCCACCWPICCGGGIGAVTHYRYRVGKATAPPGSIAAWWAAENTPAYVPIGTPFFLLVQWWNDTASPALLNTGKLQWRVSGGAFADITTSSSEVVYVATSDLVTDGEELLAAQLTANGGSAWQDGEAYDTSTAIATAKAMAANGHQEFLWALRFSKAATPGTAYEFGIDVVGDFTVTPTVKPWYVAESRRTAGIQ